MLTLRKYMVGYLLHLVNQRIELGYGQIIFIHSINYNIILKFVKLTPMTTPIDASVGNVKHDSLSTR